MGTFGDSLETICRKTQADIELVGKQVVFDVFSRCVLSSPVRTGNFRANWRIGYDTMDLSTGQPPSKGARGQEAVLQAEIKTIVDERPLSGHIVYLTNSLPYALRLEYGWSKQAPYGMVRIAVEHAEDVLRRAADEANRL